MRTRRPTRPCDMLPIFFLTSCTISKYNSLCEANFCENGITPMRRDAEPKFCLCCRREKIRPLFARFKFRLLCFLNGRVIVHLNVLPVTYEASGGLKICILNNKDKNINFERTVLLTRPSEVLLSLYFSHLPDSGNEDVATPFVT